MAEVELDYAEMIGCNYLYYLLDLAEIEEWQSDEVVMVYAPSRLFSCLLKRNPIRSSASAIPSRRCISAISPAPRTHYIRDESVVTPDSKRSLPGYDAATVSGEQSLGAIGVTGFSSNIRGLGNQTSLNHA